MTFQGKCGNFTPEFARVENGGGWREVGAKAGISGAYARMIALGRRPLTPSLRRVGWAKLTLWPPPCASRLSHPAAARTSLADCHGVPVAAVVALAPGQGVDAQRKPPTPRTLSDYPPAVLAWKLNHRALMTEEAQP